MGWLRLVGYFKVKFSFAKYSLFYRAFLQKRPVIWRSLLFSLVESQSKAHKLLASAWAMNVRERVCVWEQERACVRVEKERADVVISMFRDCERTHSLSLPRIPEKVISCRSLLQNIVSFIAPFCKRDVYINRSYWPKPPHTRESECKRRYWHVKMRAFSYGVVTISRLLKIIGLYRKRAL